METNKSVLRRIFLDVLILFCVGFPIYCFGFWGHAYKRGFFCNDESLMYPLKGSTIESWTLYISGMVLPICMILIVEIIKSRSQAQFSNDKSSIRRYALMAWEIPDWMAESYKKIGIYLFGAAACELTVHIAKYTIGRLRPHFFELCQPIMQDGSTCADSKNHGKYIVDFSCSNPLATEEMLIQYRLSFPSGHSSSCFFTMVFLALYLQFRMTWHGSKLLKHFLQFALIMSAWFTALSRISDYKHHWSDVFTGSAIGSLMAFLVANYVCGLFDKKSSESYTLPRFTRDMSPQKIKSIAN